MQQQLPSDSPYSAIFDDFKSSQWRKPRSDVRGSRDRSFLQFYVKVAFALYSFIKAYLLSSTHIVLVLVYIITRTCTPSASFAREPYFMFHLFSFFSFFFFTRTAREQQMQTLNSKSYKADIISGNIEADREAIEMQIDCWGRGSGGKKLAGMTMQVNHSSLSRRPRFVTQKNWEWISAQVPLLLPRRR